MLKSLGVVVVYLFGSRATRRASPISDTDIGVVLRPFSPEQDTRNQYKTLFKIFSGLYPHSRVDIVFLQRAPLALQFSAIRDGKVIFEQDPIFRADYENRVVKQYLDFRPVLEYFDRVAAQRYA
ncbi:MAG: nucleotidyltransferase domain-containing protein [Syntrophaceae bacterium]|nr:nucleotidyltransferase domain-containing protein [Syntrophaceae bacterium]